MTKLHLFWSSLTGKVLVFRHFSPKLKAIKDKNKQILGLDLILWPNDFTDR